MGVTMAEATIMAAIAGVATMADMAAITTEVTATVAVTHAAE